MKACILIKTQAGRFTGTAEAVQRLEGVKAAFPVMGRTDVVALVEVADLKALSNLALKIGSLEGVLATETLVGLEV